MLRIDLEVMARDVQRLKAKRVISNLDKSALMWNHKLAELRNVSKLNLINLLASSTY